MEAGEIREHCHLISVYQVHIKLPYLLLNGSVDVSYPIPLCSIYSNSSHVEWLAGSSNIILEADILRMIRPNFGLNWPSGSWGEQKSIQPTPILTANIIVCFTVSGYLLYCTVSVVFGQLHTANIIVCFTVSGYLLYCTVSVVFEQLHTANIIVCFSVAGYLLYCTVSVVFEPVCNCPKTTETVQYNK
jgi:hypothetical protein